MSQRDELSSNSGDAYDDACYALRPVYDASGSILRYINQSSTVDRNRVFSVRKCDGSMCHYNSPRDYFENPIRSRCEKELSMLGTKATNGTIEAHRLSLSRGEAYNNTNRMQAILGKFIADADIAYARHIQRLAHLENDFL